MKSLFNPSALIALVLALGAAGWIYSGQIEDDGTFVAQENFGAPPPAPPRELPSVRVADSRGQPHRAILLYTGKTEAARRAVLRAETDGRIVEIAAEESQPVEKDALIVKIANSDRFARLSEAQALVRQREIEYDAAKSLAGKGFQTESAKAEAEANLQAAKAALETIRVDIARITVEAPFDGVVESRAVEVGDYVQRGDEVAVIADFDPITVTAQVSEREISRVEQGGMAAVELVSGQRLTGLVSRIATTADEATRTFEVEIEIANENATLLDGMTAKILIPAQEVLAHRITPAMLTLNDEGQVGVKGVDADRRVVFYPIQIVEDTAAGMWIAGLPRQATLIVVGQDFVKAGAEVIVVPVDAAAPVDDSPGEDAPTMSVGQETGGRS